MFHIILQVVLIVQLTCHYLWSKRFCKMTCSADKGKTTRQTQNSVSHVCYKELLLEMSHWIHQNVLFTHWDQLKGAFVPEKNVMGEKMETWRNSAFANNDEAKIAACVTLSAFCQVLHQSGSVKSAGSAAHSTVHPGMFLCTSSKGVWVWHVNSVTQDWIQLYYKVPNDNKNNGE